MKVERCTGNRVPAAAAALGFRLMCRIYKQSKQSFWQMSKKHAAWAADRVEQGFLSVGCHQKTRQNKHFLTMQHPSAQQLSLGIELTLLAACYCKEVIVHTHSLKGKFSLITTLKIWQQQPANSSASADVWPLSGSWLTASNINNPSAVAINSNG